MFTNNGFQGWSHIASKEKLIQSYKGMGQEVEQLLALTPEDGLHIWQLLDMDFLPTYIKDSLVLIGDAANPFLPCELPLTSRYSE